MTSGPREDGGAAPVVLGALVVLALVVAAWWLLAEDERPASSPDVTVPAAGAPRTPVDALEASPPTSPPRTPPATTSALLAALDGRLAWPDAVSSLAAAAERLAAPEAEPFALREGGRRLSATLPDGREVVATSTRSDALTPDRLPKTLPWDEALERMPERNARRGAPDTFTLTVSGPPPAPLPPPWTDARAAVTERLTLTRRDGALAGSAEFVVAPLATRDLAEALAALDPPGRARAGLRFEWDAPDAVTAREVWARVIADAAPRVDVHAVSGVVRPALAAPDALERLAARLAELLAEP